MVNRRSIVTGCIAAALVVAAAAVLHAAKPAPKGYAVAEIKVTDLVGYKKYLAAVSPVVAQFGGEYLVRAGRIVPLEGAAPTGRYIVIEFPSMAIAQKFESSPQYQAIAPLRRHASRTRLFLVEGASE